MARKNIAVALFVAGLLLSILAYLFYANTQTYLSTTKQASGLVSELVPFEENGDLSYKVFVTFDSDTRQDVRIVFDIVKDENAFTVGQGIDLIYNPHLNEEAVKTSFIDLWGFAILFAGVGLSGLLISFFLWFTRHSKQ
jgi:drug/metabolite transporter (DMT)-like permease